MAIDTAFKRRSSAASRRMPWMRRFGIAPTGTIGQEQRTQGAWVYAGILPSSVSAIVGPCWAAGNSYLPGVKAGESYLPGYKAGHSYAPGFNQGQKVC